MRREREENLRLAAAVAEVEGLYSALLRAGSSDRRRLRAELARAARRLAATAAMPSQPRSATVRRTRRGRRRALAQRGVAWITARDGGSTS